MQGSPPAREEEKTKRRGAACCRGGSVSLATRRQWMLVDYHTAFLAEYLIRLIVVARPRSMFYFLHQATSTGGGVIRVAVVFC